VRVGDKAVIDAYGEVDDRLASRYDDHIRAAAGPSNNGVSTKAIDAVAIRSSNTGRPCTSSKVNPPWSWIDR
jgi:hypothetical protein